MPAAESILPPLRLDRWRTLVFTAFIALLASFALATVSHQRDVLVASAGLYLAGNVVYLLYVVFSRHCRALSLVQGLFFTLFFAAPTVIQLSLNDFPWFYAHRDSDLQTGMLVMVGGQLLIWLGFHRWRPNYRKAIPELPVNRAYGFQLALVWIGLVVIYACMPFLGFDALLGSRSDISALAEADTFRGQLVFICRSISIALFAIAVLQWRNPSRASRGVFLAVLIVLSFVALAVFNNPVASPRYQFLAMVVAVAALAIDMSRPLIKGSIVFLSVFFVFFLFPVLKLISLGREIGRQNGIFARDAMDYITSVDFDAYQWIVNTTIYLDRFSIRWGENLYGAVLFFVPRGLWDGKPVDSGTMVSEALGYPFTSVSNPVQAEAMMAFGIPGLIVLCFLFGYMIRAIEIVGSGQLRRSVTGNQMTVVYVFMAGFLPIIIRGALNANAPQFGSGLLFMLIFYITTRTLLGAPRRLPIYRPA